MGKPTFDSRNSKTFVLGFDWETERLQDHDDASRRGFGFPVIKRRYETSEYMGGFKRTQGKIGRASCRERRVDVGGRGIIKEKKSWEQSVNIEVCTVSVWA